MYREIRTLEESKNIIEPYYNRLVESISKAFNSFLEVKDFANSRQIIDFEKRTKAGIVHDHIKANIIENFAEEPNIRIGYFRRVFGIIINDELFIRFKKMDRNFKISNVLTPQHKRYMKQLDINGFPEQPTFLFAGYVPDENWLGVKGIYLACWNGELLEWLDEAGDYSFEQMTIKFEPSLNKVHKEIEKKFKLKETKVISINDNNK